MLNQKIGLIVTLKSILLLGIIYPVIASTDHTFENKQTTDQSQNTITQLANQITRSFLHKSKLGELIFLKNLQQAYQVQSHFVEKLTPLLGENIGYKVGLTNQTVQEKFKVNHPVHGSLLKKMLLPSGATISADFGSVPLLEGDLIVRVGNHKINEAKTTAEVIEALDAVIPFIELPDLMYEQTVTLTAEKLVAINVGARLGVVGKPIPIDNPQRWQQKLRNIQLILRDETGKTLAAGNSQALLGDPLNVVLWLRNDLKSQGKRLQKGDLISLGTITPFIPVTAGKTFYASYIGLNDNQPVEIFVTFK